MDFWIATESFPKSTVAIVPSVISVELTEDKTDRFPSPKFSLAVPGVVAPVPPFAIATVPVTFVAEVAVKAFPARFAVMVPAVKLPLASLETIEFGVLELVAVVALLLTFPAVVIVESFESEMEPASFWFVTLPSEF